MAASLSNTKCLEFNDCVSTDWYGYAVHEVVEDNNIAINGL